MLGVVEDGASKTRSNSEENQDVDDSEIFMDHQSSSMSSSDRVESQIISVADKRKAKREAKRNREIQKAKRSEQKHAVSCGRNLINEVATAIHGAEQNYEDSDDPLTYLHPLIQRNIGFVANQRDHRKTLLKAAARERDLTDKRKLMRRHSVSDEAQSPVNKLPDDDVVVPQVLDRLRLGIGIAHNTTTSTTPTPRRGAGFNTPGHEKRQVAALTDRIAALIAEDVNKHRNEQKETENRAAAFWRYANSEILERIRRARRMYDWRTGAVVGLGGGNWKRTGSEVMGGGAEGLAWGEGGDEREVQEEVDVEDKGPEEEEGAEQSQEETREAAIPPPALQDITNKPPAAVLNSTPRRAPVLTLKIRPVVQQRVEEDAGEAGEWTVVQKKRTKK